MRLKKRKTKEQKENESKRKEIKKSDRKRTAHERQQRVHEIRKMPNRAGRIPVSDSAFYCFTNMRMIAIAK